MSRYILIRRLRGPAFLLLAGVIALLHQMGLIERPWHLFWPLLLIMIGTFMLAERATLAAEGGYPSGPSGPYQPGQPYPGAPFAGAVDPNAVAGVPQAPPPEPPAVIPADSTEFNDFPNGGQS